MLENRSLLTTFFLLVFAVLQIHGAVSYLRAAFTDPGQPPHWLSKSYVHATVQDELKRIIEHERRLGASHDSTNPAHSPNAAMNEKPSGGFGHGARLGDARVHPVEDTVKAEAQGRGVRNHSAGDNEGLGEGRGGVGGGIQIVESADDDGSATSRHSRHRARYTDDAVGDGLVSANTMLASALAQRHRHSDARDALGGERAEDVAVEGQMMGRRSASAARREIEVEVARVEDEFEDECDDDDAHPRAVRSRENVNSASKEEEEEASDLPADLPEQMALRFELKRRRGLPVVSVEQRASKALRLLSTERDGEVDVESARQEMNFLLRGATLCRECGVYSMHDTAHCSICDRCVHWSDQHSFLLGRCVGWDNHKFFLLTITYTWAAIVWTLFTFWIGVYTQSIVLSTHEEAANVVTIFMLYSVWSMTITVLLAQYIRNTLAGESTRIQEERETRYLEANRVRITAVTGAPYCALFQNDLPEEPKLVRLSNMRRAFGDEPVMPYWFMVTAPVRPSPQSQQDTFTAQLRRMVETQIRSTADFSNETYDRQVFEEHPSKPTIADTAAPGGVEYAHARADAGATVVDVGDLDAHNQPAESIRRSRPA